MRLKLSFFMVIIYSQIFLGSYSNNCSLYRDPFGPLQTGYTMGDLMRYTITPNINVYNGLVLSVPGVSDVYNFGKNTYNLYNALGYLYAGWASLNYSNNVSLSDWVGVFRQQGGDPFSGNPQQALVNFDNNVEGKSTIHFPMNLQNPIVNNIKSLVGSANFTPGDATVSFNQTYGTYINENTYPELGTIKNANASFGWCANVSDGNYISIFGNNIAFKNIGKIYEPVPNGYIYPCGQFFGARIAHVLGVIVNDVPWSDDSTTSGASGGTGAAVTSLISGSDGKGTPVPMLAVMQGSAYTITGSGAAATSNAPQGMFQPSTAHFGSMNNFLSRLPSMLTSEVRGALGKYYNYLVNHFQPTIHRLSTLASYKMSTGSQSTNLIEIVDENITPYDNGVIVAIQNNTGDQLEINQITSQGSTVIGSLNAGNNNYFLHTASLMPSSSSSDSGSSTGTATAAPDQNHMISIVDTTEKNISAYVQILDATQLQALVGAINATLASVTVQGSSLLPFNYDQITKQNYTVPTRVSATSSNEFPAYVVVTNFNPILDSSNSLSSLDLPQGDVGKAQMLNSFRIQAVNVAEFYNQPYFLTLQINKEHVGYGIQTNYETDSSGNDVINAQGNYVVSGYSLSPGSPNSYILYPSIVSSNVCTWQNVTHVVSGNNGYSSIPLLMIPDVILNPSNASLKIPGLQAYYIIWLMSYAAAMTECSYNKVAFGDIFGVYDKVFNLFPLSNNKFTLQGSATKQISRIVVDQNQNLVSGQVLTLDNGISICGCDTWDSGGGFNQDIPILALPSATEVNKSGNDYINLSMQIGQPLYSVFNNMLGLNLNFSNKYALPYSNTMFFSLPTESLKKGVVLKFNTDSATNMYQLEITDKKGSVLAAPKIYLDKNLHKATNITIDFLRTPGDTKWKSPQVIASNIQTGLIGINGFTYNLKYSLSGEKNSLILTAANKQSLKNSFVNQSKEESFFIDEFLNDSSLYTLKSIDMKNKPLDYIQLYLNGGQSIYNLGLQKNLKNPVLYQDIFLDLSSALSDKSDFKLVIFGVDSNNNNTLITPDYVNQSLQYNNSIKIDHFRVYLVDEKNNSLVPVGLF